jgi:RimJ/RimL family protein N-acetyltransferase
MMYEYVFMIHFLQMYLYNQHPSTGETISGQPEARFEAYARAYAGCGVYSSPAYRRSYARLYEAISCVNHATENKYRQHWLERPGDMVGRTIRLEPLEADRHLENLFSMTCGDTYKENRVYDPNEIWAFLPEGPFRNPEEMRRSFVFQRKANEGGFAIIESVTDKMLGVVYLSNDNPTNLSISLELPIVKPSSVGTVEPIEGCFLLIDRLFSLGYRRVQLSIDSMDYNGKRLSGRLGFTQEGLIPKDRIIKESNRDSLIYGMLNSDWDKGARAFMYKKLHGDRAMRADAANNEKEGELETQQKVLAAQKEEAAAKEPKK